MISLTGTQHHSSSPARIAWPRGASGPKVPEAHGPAVHFAALQASLSIKGEPLFDGVPGCELDVDECFKAVLEHMSLAGM